mgnify:CR=1 FL=1
MLTIKLITENTDAVIRGLEKKHFKGAKESIDKVLELNDKRRIAQNQLDKNLAEVNATSKSNRTINERGQEGRGGGR